MRKLLGFLAGRKNNNIVDFLSELKDNFGDDYYVSLSVTGFIWLIKKSDNSVLAGIRVFPNKLTLANSKAPSSSLVNLLLVIKNRYPDMVVSRGDLYLDTERGQIIEGEPALDINSEAKLLN